MSALRAKLAAAARRAGAATATDVRGLRAAVAELRDRTQHASDRLDALDRERAGHAHRLAELEQLIAIEHVGRWIKHATLRTEPLVSIILPTRNRPELLARAIESVISQQYASWELVVVDDGSDPPPGDLFDAHEDERIRLIRIDRGLAAAARNAGLEAARGELIAYLDDDNVMDPGWLRAVVWAFEQRPDVDVLYGAFVIDDVGRLAGGRPASLPKAFLRPWNRAALRHGNLADIGALAHRRGLPEARFDESLREMVDWDLLLALTAERDPLVLPAIACYYTTEAPDRLTGGPTHEADLAAVIARAGALSRPAAGSRPRSPEPAPSSAGR